MLIAAACLILVQTGLQLFRRSHSATPMSPYVTPQFWLSYHEGFVRRGLPGEVLRLLEGDHAPSLLAVKVAGLALAAGTGAAVVLLAVVLARRARSFTEKLLTTAVILVTPLTLSLYLRDVGRYDAIGVIVLAILGCTPWGRLPRGVAVASVAFLAAVAVACTEFLIVFVVPLSLLVMVRDARGRHPAAMAAVTQLPALTIATLSAVLKPANSYFSDVLGTALAHGAPQPVNQVPDHDSVSRLKHGFVDNALTYYSITDAATVITAALMWAAVFVVTLCLVWTALGRSLRQRAFQAVVGTASLAALSLSLAGIDFRRWWALATVAALAALVKIPSGGEARSLKPWQLLASAVFLAVAGIRLERMPGYFTHLF
jgi:hypothetical protein